MKRLLILPVLTLLMICQHAQAQQSQDFGEFTVHYSALNTNFLTPQVAQAYDIQRSSSRAMINITVIKRSTDQPDTPVKASVIANARNLTGQNREIEIREIADSDNAIYYIGELSVRNLEMFNFTISVTPEDSDQVLDLSFRQQFYTE